MTYAVVYEQSPKNYSAYVPDLPGCIATGKTRAIVERRIRKGIAMHLEAMREDGELVPLPTTSVGLVEIS
ncbi:MAG: type II toxin-antitoxin system HicB family antitoxin [Chloroflexi bacterium]|nr:type II toxin-antitoxin system HicB family antitoxin [Chloroflexota bacterium]